MNAQTPSQDQAQINAIPWTNSRGAVTGAVVLSVLTAIVGTFALYAPLSGATFTGPVSAPSISAGASVLNYAGGAITSANSILTTTTFAYGAFTGTGVNGYPSPFSIAISDIVQAGGAQPYYGMSVIDVVGAGATGYRAGIQGAVNVSGTPGSYMDAVGLLGLGFVSANMGGSAGSYANASGAVFGGNSQVIAKSGATYLSTATGHEFDTSINTGASASESHGLTVVHTLDHRVRATYDDSAIEVAAQDNASNPGWKYGVAFGGYGHQWDFTTDSTLIYAWTRQAGAASASVANIGIDFSNVSFTTAFLKSTGFLVDGSGAETAATLKLTAIPTSAGGGGLYVCADSTGATYKKASCP